MSTNEKASTEGFQGDGQSRSVMRKEINIPITIYCHSFPYLVCRARELGSDGILVDGDFTNLPSHAYLEAEFSDDVGGETRRFRLPVYVDGMEYGSVNLLFAFPAESGMQMMAAVG